MNDFQTNNGWKPAYMKLNKEEKIARINEILKELRQNPTLPLATLLTKWSITKEDFDLYRENGMISRGKTSRGRASMHENSSNSLTLVCPVTKLPLPVIAKIRGIIKVQKKIHIRHNPLLIKKHEILSHHSSIFKKSKL